MLPVNNTFQNAEESPDLMKSVLKHVAVWGTLQFAGKTLTKAGEVIGEAAKELIEDSINTMMF